MLSFNLKTVMFKSRDKERMVKKETTKWLKTKQQENIQYIFLHELIKITQNFLEVADFPTGTEKRMLTNGLHSLNILVP